MKIDAIIFDFDEVVIYSYSNHAQSFVKAAKKFGLKITKEQIFERFGKSAVHILTELFPDISQEVLLEVEEEKDREYRRMISKKGIRVLDGLRKLLEFLRKKKIKCGIASSAAMKNIKIGLRKSKLEKYFQAIVAAESVKRHKPYPDPLFKVARMLQVKPRDCVYIGDSIYEMISAKRAGVTGFGILTGFYSRKQLKQKGAKFVFKNHKEILNFLQSARI